MSSTFYDSMRYYDTLLFTDVFQDSADFVDKIESVGGVTNTDDLSELYDILSLKYFRSHTRYTDEFAFVMALKRELYTAFPFYIERKKLAKMMMDIEIQDIMIAAKQLRNIVDNMDTPVTEADSVPVNNRSTMQESLRAYSNELEAIQLKYEALNRDYLIKIYEKCDQLFRVILSSDTTWLYPEGENE